MRDESDEKKMLSLKPNLFDFNDKYMPGTINDVNSDNIRDERQEIREKTKQNQLK